MIKRMLIAIMLFACIPIVLFAQDSTPWSIARENILINSGFSLYNLGTFTSTGTITSTGTASFGDATVDSLETNSILVITGADSTWFNGSTFGAYYDTSSASGLFIDTTEIKSYTTTTASDSLYIDTTEIKSYVASTDTITYADTAFYVSGIPAAILNYTTWYDTSFAADTTYLVDTVVNSNFVSSPKHFDFSFAGGVSVPKDMPMLTLVVDTVFIDLGTHKGEFGGCTIYIHERK